MQFKPFVKSLFIILIGLPLLYQWRSEQQWYRDICERGITATGEVVSLTSLTRRSGSGWSGRWPGR